MANDGYIAHDPFFAAALMCQFGPWTLLRIEETNESGSRRDRKYHLDIAPEDGKAFLDDWNKGLLGVTDLKKYSEVYSDLTWKLKVMQRDGLTEWNPSWIAGRG